jgi:hypothetical protein
MPKFNPANLKGHEAVERALKSSGGGFKPFIPQITWKDGEEKYLLVISPASEFYTTDLHEFIEVGEGKKANGDTYTKYESFVSRKSLGEKHDKIQDELNRDPRRRTLAVAVELEPEFETVKGRKRFSGAAVKTETFTRKDDDDGEEEVTVPAIGMVIQSQKNFFGYLISYDRTKNPTHETVFSVTREGDDSDTNYVFVPFSDAEVDLDPLFDNVENVSYLADEIDDILKAVSESDNEWDAVAEIGTAMLDKRFGELADEDRYDELIGPIDELPPSRFGAKKTTSKGSSSKRAARPKRESQQSKVRKVKKSDDSNADSDRMKRFAKLREEIEGDEDSDEE